jgi:hypothetical protein
VRDEAGPEYFVCFVSAHGSMVGHFRCDASPAAEPLLLECAG